MVSSPSDGVERTVANQLGLRYGLSPYRFSLVGLICGVVAGVLTRGRSAFAVGALLLNGVICLGPVFVVLFFAR